ncbi:hypothetical protein G647_01259 [Cladophialophora carrionii CBS 160.54]|uniref:Inner kinetochore subunit AME1 domain-containing protein n=1 Tax=Cladophialophora carrionii CBS 160.54 TaxID=1279043 RepID=V9DS78_9EURO|nr:uncharacterized protein G647_01259 [Cladophialophora carrionii CBS 160.54]ETI28807.1 hypothetical protein G647_01259 [Cladophialophora carrionii CBS 160.54]
MAASTREDRALMRVRGAGSRKPPAVDFGFNFAFGSKKNERQQIPTPARSLRSNTKTPQSRRASSKQPSKTPAAKPVRQSSVAPDERDGETSTQPEESARSSKRRKITPEQPTPNNTISVEIPRSTPSSRALRRRTSSRVFTIAEDEDVPQINGPTPDHEEVEQRQQQKSPLFVPQHEQQKENETPKDQGSKSTNQDSNWQTTKSGRILLDPTTLPEDATEEDVQVLQPEYGETRPSASESPLQYVTKAPSISKQNKRRSRKSFATDKRREPSSTLAQSTIEPQETSAAAISSRLPSEQPPSPSVLPLSDRISKYSKLARKVRKRQAQNPASEREEGPKEAENDDEDDSYVEESEPEPETPAASKKATRQPRKRRSRSRPAEVPGGKKSTATFPILTHRLTNVVALPTMNEEDEEGMPSGDMSFDSAAARTQPNAVDILAQICRETISNMMERVAASAQTLSKATANNQRTALEAFGKDLDDELFAMSEAVENRANLEARVRKSKREKAALQSEYLELRREREQIALRCDAVRRQHWECEEETRQRWTLSEAARRVEQEMERAEADEDEGLEFLLRSVTESVSSTSGRGGILDKVKSFNAQLENMALLLEGRRV